MKQNIMFGESLKIIKATKSFSQAIARAEKLHRDGNYNEDNLMLILTTINILYRDKHKATINKRFDWGEVW